MKKLRPNLTADYSSQGLSTLKKAVSQLLATRAIPELTGKKHIVRQTVL